jgi:hypothetical protein
MQPIYKRIAVLIEGKVESKAEKSLEKEASKRKKKGFSCFL